MDEAESSIHVKMGELIGEVRVLQSDVKHAQSDVTEIKTDVRELRRDMRTDFRVLFGAIIVSTLGVAWLMAKGFGWV